MKNIVAENIFNYCQKMIIHKMMIFIESSFYDGN